MVKVSKHVWDEIRDAYVTGYRHIDPVTGASSIVYPTHQELADKYGLTKAWLSIVASRDEWSKQRRIFQEKIQDFQTEKRFSVYTSDSAQLDSFILDSAKELVRIVRREIKRLSPDENDPANDGLSDEIEVKPQDLLTLTKCLGELQAVGKKACGEPLTSVSENSLKEAKKTATSASKTAPDKTTRIEQLIKEREKLSKQMQELKEAITSDA